MGAVLSNAAQGMHQRLLSAGALRDACSVALPISVQRTTLMAAKMDIVCSVGVSSRVNVDDAPNGCARAV